MGFNKVYKSLKDIFPQIDARVLRAVAIEHSKDCDAAVETVLVEIIPFFTQRSRSNTPLNRSISVGESSEAHTSAAATKPVDDTFTNTVQSAEAQYGNNINDGNQQSIHDADGHNEPFYDTYGEHLEAEGNSSEIALPKEILDNSTKTGIDVCSHVESTEQDGLNTFQTEASRNPETDVTISADKHPGNSVNILSEEDKDIEIIQNMDFPKECSDNGHLKTELLAAINKESDQLNSCSGSNNSAVEPSSATVHDLTANSPETSVQCVVLPDMNRSDLEELNVGLLNNTDSKMETDSNNVGPEVDSTMNASITQSSQIHIIEVLEEIIADARNNKKTLFSSMQSVISLMREVELKEQAAEQAKVEAAMGGTDILVKVEELKEILKHAKEANNMHAGEVYGEKSILATELRELHSRVLSLSDEKEKSLGVLDEMRQTLEVRLSAAENEIKAAEQEKIEKEKAAMKVLAEHELILEKVMEEKVILKQQAEDNAKLQEFLMDRGRVVDMLRGEIAVICHDVRLLKENFDDRIPLSKSLSSSQTSCILASSTSSSKSSIPEQAESKPAEADDLLETQKKSFSNQKSSEAEAEAEAEVEAARDDRKALADDGWEFFDEI